MHSSDYKTFRDSKNKLIISYWNMNKGETFFICDLSQTNIAANGLDDNKQAEDFGCTFLTSGSGTIQEVGNELIITAYAGDISNRRGLKSVKITALEDNTRWCYALHYSSLFTSNQTLGLDWETANAPKILEGEQIKASADEVITFVDKDKDNYIVNPICDDELQPISYKTSDSETFTNLKYGKYLKIEKGKSYDIKSNIDIYIPKIHFINK